MMARPRNKNPSVKIDVTVSPKLARYLDELRDKDGFGSSRPEIVRNFVWKEINRLLEIGRLEEV